MDLNNIYLLASAASLIVMAYLAIKEARSKRDNNVSAAVKNLADALNLSTSELSESIVEASKLRGMVDELIAHRNEREGRIVALEMDLRALHAQVVDWESKYNALKDKYNKAIEITARTMEKAGIEVPEELVLLLGDSIRKFKWPRKP